jgi:hypothetical protein
MEKSTWGGSREGSGRPAKDDKKVSVSISLTPEELLSLDELCQEFSVSRSAAVGILVLQRSEKNRRLRSRKKC